MGLPFQSLEEAQAAYDALLVQKADQSAMDAANTVIATKAAQSSLDILATTVTGKADSVAMTTALNAKANLSGAALSGTVTAPNILAHTQSAAQVPTYVAPPSTAITPLGGVLLLAEVATALNSLQTQVTQARAAIAQLAADNASLVAKLKASNLMAV